jgi:Ca-activated chloride channel family protein
MTLTWTNPAALWLLAAVPLLWAAIRFARTNFNPRQRIMQTIVRSLLLTLLVTALARPVVSAGSTHLSVVYVVDVSHSVDAAEITRAAKAIDELNAAARPAHSRIVVFGADAAAVETTEQLRQFAVAGKDGTANGASSGAPNAPPSAPLTAAVDRSGTDLEAALTFAKSVLEPGAVPRMVLFSDGRPTAGDMAAAVARLHADGVQVSVMPLSPPALGDTWVEAIAVPDRISAGATFEATVEVSSQRRGDAAIELRTAGRVLASRTVSLAAGTTPVTLDAKLDETGAQAIEAVVTMSGDPVRRNDRLERAVWVDPRPRVLYVEGAPGDSAKYLTGALTAAGVDVAVRAPSALLTAGASTGGPLDPFDVVILSDVARSLLPDAAMRTLGDWVETQGGGLLIAGGDAVFGEGPEGYRKTELERLAPVTFERRDEPEIALVIVLDKSYSMNGAVLELCKGAAQAAIDALSDEQSVGLITFNDKFNWDVTLRNVGKSRDEIRAAVSAIQASGGTLIYPPLEQAYGALNAIKARAKHVVLLSDGRSYPDDFEGLVKKMVAAKITVSSIAVGPVADGELLGNIAKWGHGRSYTVLDAREVPQIFVKEAKDVPNLAFDEKKLEPVVKHQGFLEGIDFTKAPALRGRTATVIKDSALELLSTRDGDPLLAFWPIGLGRAAVFASDVKDRWATDWVTWRGYGPFFAAVVRALERQRPQAIALSIQPGIVHGTTSAGSTSATRTMTVFVDARDAQGRPREFLTPRVRMQSGTKPFVEVPARQTAPGHYEARAIVDAAQPFAATVVATDGGADTGVTSALVVPDPNEEYRFRPPDEARLRAIADATGGQWMPTPASLANTKGEHRTTRRPLWPALLWTALGLWMVDLLLRRVRVFERT